MKERLRILILDDEPIVGKRLVPSLNKMGCETEAFVAPETALKRIEEAPFDIVVTDIRMEGLSGIEVLQRVLSLSPKSKVIMITGYATMEVAREALAKGAFDFIAKPFKPGDLRKVITRAARTLGFELKEPGGPADESQVL